jgi:hypothetical protein
MEYLTEKEVDRLIEAARNLAINSEIHCASAGSICEVLEGLAFCESP